VGADRAVTHFSIAHNSRYKTADGEQREEVTFIDCEAWGRQGEIAAQYLTKGTMVIVEGRIKQDNWTDKEGQKRSRLKLSAERVHLTPRGARDDSQGDGRNDGHNDPAEATSPSDTTRTSTPRAPAPARPASTTRAPAKPTSAATSFNEQPPF